MKFNSLMLKIRQAAIGVAIGVSAYAILALTIKDVYWAEFASGPIAYFFLLPVLLIGAVILVLIVQVAVTIWLTNRGFAAVALGIWLSLPVLPLLANEYYQIRNALYEAEYLLASNTISPSRKLTHPSKEMRTLVIALRTRITGSDGVARADPCWALCAAILKAGIADSIAVPSDDGYVINELARGKACKHTAVTYHNNVNKNKAMLPVIGKSNATSVLSSAGYFDECITARFSSGYDYDIRVDYRKKRRWSSNSCCYIAEVFERFDEGDKLLGRWLKGWGKLAFANSFEVSDIITELTGKPVDQFLAPQRRLKPFPVVSLEEELARLTGFARDGAYIYDWEIFLRWVDQVLDDERRRASRQFDKMTHQPDWDLLHVSDTAIGQLVEILSIGPAEYRVPYLKRFSAWMRRDSKQRLGAAWKRVGVQ